MAGFVGRCDAVNCYFCVSTNYVRGDDTCLEDSFNEEKAPLLTDCDCCRVRTYSTIHGSYEIRDYGNNNNSSSCSSSSIVAAVISIVLQSTRNFRDICLEANRNFFRKILHYPEHVLHQLLLPQLTLYRAEAGRRVNWLHFAIQV